MTTQGLNNLALILLNKPAGITSFDCIRNLKKILNRKDIGHGGTLDSFATGLLPIFTQEGLKLSRFFTDHYPHLATYWKTYSGVIKLGVQTDTGDPTGITIQTSSVGSYTHELIQTKMNEFVDKETLQTPPTYSAKKVDGKRSSDSAREGTIITLKSVPVFIKEFKCIKIQKDEIHFECTGSKGLYIRVLAEDLAKKLETVGHLIKLTRTAVGDFQLENAISLDELNKTSSEIVNKKNSFLSIQEAVNFIPKIELHGLEPKELKNGKLINIQARLLNSGLQSGTYCTWDTDEQRPCGLFQVNKEENTIQVLRVIN